MNTRSKRILLFVISILLVAGIIGGSAIAIISYNNKKPDRLRDDFIKRITGVWEGSSEISSLNFTPDGAVTLSILSVPVNGSYTVECVEETKKSYDYSINLTYSTAIGVSISRSFDAILYDEDSRLTLRDKKTGLELKYSRYSSDSATQYSTTKQTTTTSSSTALGDATPLLGKWQSNSDTTGYEFLQGGVVKIKLLSLNVDGTYLLTEESDGKLRLKISYKTVIGTTVSNSYYANIDGDTLVLTQIGLESVSLNYTRQ